MVDFYGCEGVWGINRFIPLGEQRNTEVCFVYITCTMCRTMRLENSKMVTWNYSAYLFTGKTAN